MMSFDVSEAEEKLDEAIDRALQGEDVIVTENGKPRVKLLPFEQEPLSPSEPV